MGLTKFKNGQELTEEEISKVSGGYNIESCPWCTRAIYIGDSSSLLKHQINYCVCRFNKGEEWANLYNSYPELVGPDAFKPNY